VAKAKPKIPVLFDSAEQKPWAEFDADVFTLTKANLFTGDYTVEGYQDRICIERKSIGDLVQTFVRDWLRFRRQLYRMAGFDLALIVVEANVADVWEHRYESDADPASVIGRAHACLIDHGVGVMFAGPRAVCVPTVERLLIQAVEKMGGVR
jgi:DNA excision repair protein ERCC-4